MRQGWWAVAVVVVFWAGPPVAAQPGGADPQLAQLVADWQQRYDKLKTVRYTVTGTVEFKDKPLMPDDDPLPHGNPVRPVRVVLLLDLERKRFRLERTEDVREPGRYATRSTTTTFDGTETNNIAAGRGGPGSSDPDLSIARGDLSQLQIESWLWPVFFAHGIVPTSHAPLAPPSLARPYDSDLWEVSGEQTLNGRRCLIVRTAPLAAAGAMVDEMWVDPGRSWCVVRRTSFTDGKPWTRLDIEHKQTDFGWWPERWTHTWTLGGQVRRIRKLQIDSFEANPPVTDADFTIPAKPGMTISVHEYPELGTGRDPRYPAQRTYQVTPSGRWEEISAKGFTTLDGTVLPPERTWWGWWAVGVGVAIAAVLVVVIALRRRQAAG